MTDHPASSSSRSPSRRTFLLGTTLGAVAGAAAGWFSRRHMHSAPPPSAGPTSTSPMSAPLLGETDDKGPLAMPGPFPGRVVEIRHSGALGTSKKKGYTERNREAVKAMIDRGMTELVGSEDAVQAWRHFFAPGDRVGIKVVPVGKPDSISSYEVVLEIIDGLRSAGVRLGDILLFDRYVNELVTWGYPEILPDGVHWEGCSYRYDGSQLTINGQMPNEEHRDHVAGYDPDVYREVAYCMPSHEPDDDRRFRSHLTTIVTRKIDKLICIPVLKDHRSAGVTLALKNLSHGLVNNVARSHATPLLNQCGTFIPTMASMPQTRAKAVLHILDGLVATWEGGPQTENKTFATWPYKSLFFATDPVALDHIGWEIIDRKRRDEGWPIVAQMGLDAHPGVGKNYTEMFTIRQPQHIPLAETLGLGIFDRARIEHRAIKLA